MLLTERTLIYIKQGRNSLYLTFAIVSTLYIYLQLCPAQRCYILIQEDITLSMLSNHQEL